MSVSLTDSRPPGLLLPRSLACVQSPHHVPSRNWKLLSSDHVNHSLSQAAHDPGVLRWLRPAPNDQPTNDLRAPHETRGASPATTALTVHGGPVQNSASRSRSYPWWPESFADLPKDHLHGTASICHPSEPQLIRKDVHIWSDLGLELGAWDPDHHGCARARRVASRIYRMLWIG